MCGLMRYLRNSGQPKIDFFSDAEFYTFRSSLDAEMNRLQTSGFGSKKRQAEEITEEEILLWEKGLLGDLTPHTLFQTMIVCILPFVVGDVVSPNPLNSFEFF